MRPPSRDDATQDGVTVHTSPLVGIFCGRFNGRFYLIWLIMTLVGCGCRCQSHVISPRVTLLTPSVVHHNPAADSNCKQRGRCGVVVSMRSLASEVSMESGDDALRNVIVTGANRGLGFAIADRMLTLGGYRVVLACRSRHEGAAALERLRARQQERQQHGRRQQGGRYSLELLVSVHTLDVSCERSIQTFRQTCVDGHLRSRVDFLFNNAGVCLPEDNGDGAKNGPAAAGILRETLTVNFFGALKVVEACLPALKAAAAAATARRGKETRETATTADVGAATRRMSPPAPPTVVWISSGEGELCFLGSKWRRLLADAKTLEDVKQCVSGLLDPATAAERAAVAANEVMKGENTAAAEAPNDWEEARTFSDSQEEIAFGPTPAYSLSKAAANAAVRTWAPRLFTASSSTGAPKDTKTGIGGGAAGVRLVAVCPGDVLTRMTSEEEMVRGEAVLPEDAAVAVVDVALGPATDFPPGRFYRDGKEIGW